MFQSDKRNNLNKMKNEITSSIVNSLTRSDKNPVINHEVVTKLVLQLEDEGEYLIELQRKHIESVFDEYKTMIIGYEIEDTIVSIKKKDFLLKTMYKVASYKECLTK